MKAGGPSTLLITDGNTPQSNHTLSPLQTCCPNNIRAGGLCCPSERRRARGDAPGPVEGERRQREAESSEDQSPSRGQGCGWERSPFVAPLDPETVAWDERRQSPSLWTRLGETEKARAAHLDSATSDEESGPSIHLRRRRRRSPPKHPVKKIPRVDSGKGRQTTSSVPNRGSPEGGRRADGLEQGAYEPLEELSAAREPEEDEANLPTQRRSSHPAGRSGLREPQWMSRPSERCSASWDAEATAQK
ncbi:hypothetical protein AWZ03_015290, partial [Drosophila navojoa]